ncbi:MAG: glycerol-3-phosphate dehydrogenase/oxidase [Bacteroidales bacterium]
MDRKTLINNIPDGDQRWDVIVIGGGATGLGTALDSTLRGYKTLLLEQSDFAKGTSSRSTKLVHGGVRYLAQGDILLVKEALRERGLMLKNAPHLTEDQEFVIPVYTFRDVILYTTGLKFYDLLAGRLSLGKSYFIDKKKVLARLPLLKGEGLKGGIVYHDGQFDDSRMAIALAKACVENGATVLNYFRVRDLTKDKAGKINGVIAKDLDSGKEYSVRSRLVINATGVFADIILKMDDPGSRPTIRPSQGVHIVLDSSFLRSRSAIMIPRTDDGRVLFAIPWYGKVVVGTTDTPLGTIALEPKALEEEIGFILRNAGKYLSRPPRREDVLSIFAGLRPLAADPDNPEATKEISRRHKITLSRSGLLSVTGGKWTSYRRMAEETLNRSIRAGILPSRKCITGNFSLYPGAKYPERSRLMIYGNHAYEIVDLIKNDPSLGETIHAELPYTRAEIVWICRNEMPLTIEDILARRTRALFLDVRASLAAAPEVASIMAGELGFGKEWETRQLESYSKLTTNYL